MANINIMSLTNGKDKPSLFHQKALPYLNMIRMRGISCVD